MTEILICVGIFWLGLLVGFLLRAWMTNRFRDYSGTIVVDRDAVSEKIVYSLILDDYPEKLEFKKEVIFKVDTPGESPNRD